MILNWKDHNFHKLFSSPYQSSRRSRDTSCIHLWEPVVSYQGVYQTGQVIFYGLLFSGKSSEPFMRAGSNGNNCWMLTKKWYAVRKTWLKNMYKQQLDALLIPAAFRRQVLLGYGVSDLGTRGLAQNGYLMIRVIISRGVGSFARHYFWTCRGILKQSTWKDS